MELASAYVAIIPSLRGAQRQIESALSGVNVSGVGSEIGSQLSSSVGKSLDFSAVGERLQEVGGRISAVGDRLTSSITKPAALAATAVAGIFVAAGWKRLVAIDDARAKLAALGNSAETVETIMSNALEAVKGTSYGLGDAATVAASAVAAGIEPGKDLSKYLTMVGDAAAVAGIGMNDMGSILNKVQTSQIAYTEDLNQLADRGIPVYQWLGEAAGKSGAEIKKMAADGQISSQMLYDAIEANIGGAAKIMGETSFTGALSNVWAAIGRVGAAFLDAGGQGGGFFSVMKPYLADFTGMLDSATGVAAEWGKTFGDAVVWVIEKVKALITWWQGLDPAVQKTIGVVAGIVVALGPVISILGSITTWVGGAVAGIGTLVAAFSGVGGAAAGAGSAAAGIGGVLSKIGPVARVAFGWVGVVVGLISSLIAASPQLQATLGAAFEKIGEALGQVMAAVGPLVDTLVTQLAPVFDELVAALAPLIEQLVTALVPVITQVISVVGQILTTVMPVVTQILAAVLPLVTQLITAITPFITFVINVLTPVIKGILTIVTAVFTALGPVIQAALTIIQGIIQTITSLISGDWSGVWQGIQMVLQGVWDFIVACVQGNIDLLLTIIQTVGDTISSVWTTLWETVTSYLSDVWNNVVSGIESGFQGVSDFLSGVPDAVMGFFDGIGDWLVDSGKALIEGFANGIKAGFERAVQFVQEGLDWVASFFPHSPAKRGPFSGRGWVSYSGAAVGETFMGSIGESLKSNAADVRSGMTFARSELSGLSVSGAAGVGDLAVSGGGQSSPSAQVVQQIYGQEGMSAREVADTAVDRLNFELRGV